MSMQFIRDTYGVPAKRGGRVQFTRAKAAAKGAIIGARSHYLRVRMDGCENIITLHPMWHIVYLHSSAMSKKTPATTS